MNIQPIAGTMNRVFVIPSETEVVTKGGIFIPEIATEKPQKGVVHSVSALCQGDKPVVQKGDRVLYQKHSGTSLQLDGKELLIMRESDIFAVLLD